MTSTERDVIAMERDIEVRNEEAKNALRELADLLLENYFQQGIDIDSIYLNEDASREIAFENECIEICIYPHTVEEVILSLIEDGVLEEDSLEYYQCNNDEMDEQEDWERRNYPF